MKWTWMVPVVVAGCRSEPRARPPVADAPEARATARPDAGPRAPDAAPPAPDAAPPDAAPSACAGARTVKTYDDGDRGKTITLKVGQAFAVELSAARHRSHWGPAELSGTSVELAGRDVVGPPPDVDGGSNQITYRFCAKAKGTTTLAIPSGGDVPQGTFTLTIKVRG